MKSWLISIILLLQLHLVFSKQNRPYTASFVGKMGTDTVLVETYNMINDHLFGKAFIRIPEDYIGQFDINFYPGNGNHLQRRRVIRINNY